MNTLPDYDGLEKIEGLYKNDKLDESRTCVYWNDRIDLPSDTIYKYGTRRFFESAVNCFFSLLQRFNLLWRKSGAFGDYFFRDVVLQELFSGFNRLV